MGCFVRLDRWCGMLDCAGDMVPPAATIRFSFAANSQELSA